MALEKLTQDVASISKLDNYPPDDVGMTPDKLKSLFDKGSNTIKDYINNTLLPQLEQGYVSSIARTSGDGSAGSTDTYTISFHDGTAITFDIYNGVDGAKGDTGNGIASVSLNEDYTLTINFTNGDTYTTPVPIRGEKGDTGIGIASVDLVSGNHAAGTFDTYRITLTDNTTYDFQVYNGADGEGTGDMRKAVYDTDNDGKVDAAEVADYADEAGHAETADSATSAGYATTAGSSNSVSWSNVQNPPSTYAPSAHANSHKTGGSDALSAADIGLGNVDNVKQMPIAGGTFTGKAYAQSNTDYTTSQIRNIVLSTSDPSGGSNGDVWIKYT
jgi:hypothetical protein